jgi:hypothetical protein
MPASGELVRLDVCGDPADLIVRFLNTLDVEAGSDVLDTVEGWQSWLAVEGLEGALAGRACVPSSGLASCVRTCGRWPVGCAARTCGRSAYRWP